MQVISGKVQKAKKVTLYGPEGIGKSSFAAQFPRSIFIDTEGSTTELNVDRLPKPTSWTMLLQHVDWVKQNSNRFGTLVIDTIDWAEMLCVESVCSQHGKKGIEDFGYGNGYVYVKEEFGRFLNKLSDVIEAGVNVVLTAHSQIIKFEQPDEMGSYDRYQLKLGKKTSSQTAPLVKEWADMVLFMNYKTFSVASSVDSKGKATNHKAQGGVRTIYANHHPAWDAKNRHNLPDEFPMEYANIAHLFNAAAPQQATPPPQRTAEELTHVVVNGLRNAGLEEQKHSEQRTDGLSEQEVMGKGITVNPAIPPALRDLMIQHDVDEIDVQAVVSQKGYYPLDTPIVNYDPTFINGVLVGAWPQVHKMITDFKASIPFK